jgi:hypothetical protein
MGSPIWVLDLLQYVWCHFTTYLPPCPSGAYAVLRLKNGRTNRAKSKKVSSEPLLWLGAGSPPAKDGTKTTEETPREVGGPARRTTPWPPPRGPGATQAGAGGCVLAPDVHMGPSGAWGVSGVLKLVYK